MIDRLPSLLAAIALSIYWTWVVIKLVQHRLKFGKVPNAIPREPVGRAMRVLWYPCIGALLVSLWCAAFPNRHWPALVLPLWTHDSAGIAWYATTIPASLLCLAATLFTFVCWRKMGRSWRIGIDPGEKLALVSTGPYRYVRHPIYALRMLINICAFLMAPTPLVLAAAAIDFILLQIEARREERYMESKHPAEYAQYKKSAGRFLPRPSAA